MKFDEAAKLALSVRSDYEKLETSLYGRCWNKEELALGFVGDVGDLCKLVLADSGIREIAEHKSKLAHELSDCLWSLFVLADKCDIELEASFIETMQALKSHISDKLNTLPVN